jgi:urease accessory protein
VGTTWSAHQDDGRPLLVESLDLDASSLAPGLLGPHRVLASVTALGRDVPADTCPEGRLDLERGGTLWRHLADETHEVPAGPWECATTG